MPIKSASQRRALYAKDTDLAAKFAADKPKGKFPERFHPAMKQAVDKWHELHGGKFKANAGRGFKKKK